MTKALVLALDQLSGSTVAQAQAANADLGKMLSDKIAAQRKTAVLARFSGASSGLIAALQKIDYSPTSPGGNTLKAALVTGLGQQKMDATTAQEAAKKIVDLERSGLVSDTADANTTIAQHPLFQQELKQAALYKLTDGVKLADAKADRLVAVAGSPVRVNDATLAPLVTDKTLTQDEATSVGLATSLYHLTGGVAALAATMSGKVKTVQDAAKLSVTDWQQAITDSHAVPPAGLDAKGYAAALRRAAANLFPTDALLALQIPADTAPLTQALTTVAPLAARNPQLFGLGFENLDTTAVTADQLTAIKTAHTQLQALANQHPGLALNDVLNGTAAPADKIATVSARLAVVQKLRTLNPTTEFMGLDYTAGSADLAALHADGIAASDQQLAIADFKATQRVYAITRDVDHAGAVMAAGYASAKDIATEELDTFQQKTGLASGPAGQYHVTAISTLSKASNALISAIDAYGNLFNALGVGNVLPEVQDYLKAIPGFSDLFGNQDYCNCTECQSILGAAAYFVDLMTFVEEHVLGKVFTGSKAGDQLNLKVRRPDLWTLPLTCDNTNNLVPYLDIINQTLENYIATSRGYTGSLSDRAAVEEAVYHQAISASVSSLNQPVTLPLTRLDIYLEHFSVPRLQIARTLAAAAAVVEKAALKISDGVWKLITTANTDPNFLKAIYDIAFAFTGTAAGAVNVQDMLTATGYSRGDFGDLAATRFVTNNGAIGVQIRAEKSNPNAIQNDVEHVLGLTTDALDRMHRFTRLLRALPWAVRELDLVLTQLAAAGLATGIGEPAVSRIAAILALAARWGLPVDQNCALWSPIPQIALDSTQGSLFDRLFNFPPFVMLDGPLPRPTVKFIHASFRAAGTPSPADNTTHRLLAGLQVNDDGLAALINNLANALGANLGTPNESDRGFDLSLPNLTLLYRHAVLAQLLDLSVDDLFQLIGLAAIPNHLVASLDDLLSLLNFYDWYQPSGYALDDLGIITHGQVRNPAVYPNGQTLASAIVAGVATDHALELADTVFAFLPGVTEQQSGQIIAANPTLFEPVPNTTTAALRLTPAFNPGVAIVIPAGVAAAPADVIGVLLKYHASRIIPSRFAGLIGLEVGKVTTLVAMTGADLASAALIQALEGGAIAPLVTLASQMIPLKVMFASNNFDADGLTFIQQNPTIFAVASFNAVSIANVRKLSVYASAASKLTDTTPLRAALAAFTSAQHFNNADPVGLASVLGIEPAKLATMLPNLTLPGTAPEAFTALANAAALAEQLGVGGDTLTLILSDDYTQQARASDAVLSAFRAQYTAQQDFLTQLQPFDDRIRSRKRDALTDYILRAMGLQFATLDDLYDFFLLDVQLQGCARTSWVVAAISSVQLYVYRCLMNLEQDRRAPSDPAHIHVQPQSIPSDEWEWRQNFRVWQANRKVFLYPESYIEPELRDDKTPLFEDLESNLLQQPINEQNVLDAYATYLSGFDELSKLQIAGSYQDIDTNSRTDVLHVFGVTSSDPPTYYYRTIDNAIYGETESDRSVVYNPWQLINVQIPGREVAPVVYLGRLFVFWTEVTTLPVNTVENGGSTFTGYRHHLKIKYTSLRLDGTWTAPQQLALTGTSVFPLGDGIVDDPLTDPGEAAALGQALANLMTNLDFQGVVAAMEAAQTPRYDTKIHTEPVDGYTLTGFQWDRVYPTPNSSLQLTGRNFVLRGNIDFYNQKVDPLGMTVGIVRLGQSVLCSRSSGGLRQLYTGYQDVFLLDVFPWCSIISKEERIQKLAQTSETGWIVPFMEIGLYVTPIASMDDGADIAVINNSITDAVIDVKGDLLLLQGSARPGDAYLLKRLGTTLSERLSRILFVSGVDGLLSIDTQSKLGESGASIAIDQNIHDAVVKGRMDFKGTLGTYFREIFFHVPFLIASQLNSQQNFQASQSWYQYIFNPTADEVIKIPPGTTAAKQAKMERDRVWRYIEFRNLNMPTLRQILTDPATIEAYKKNPFNPDAIARLRLSAYQKCIVMKYVDNLIDWGDQLFTEFTMESVNEATMLYVMALEILGPRPAEIGDCGKVDDSQRTYANIAPLVKKGSEFLVEMETYTWVATGAAQGQTKILPKFTYVVPGSYVGYFVKDSVNVYKQPSWLVEPAPAANENVAVRSQAVAATQRVGQTIERYQAPPVAADAGVAQPTNWRQTHVSSWFSARGKSYAVSANNSPSRASNGVRPHFGWGIARQVVPAFCVPPNDDLLAYWDRVEDRLYKIRHCQDITGASRQLALFAPPIDPRLLVEARAAGLSLDDVLSSISGDLPPYRFTYLIDKAKQYAALVQSFGGALLSAIEKRDGEQLNLLRLTQTQNILTMTTSMRQGDLDAAQNAVDSLTAQLATVQYRHDYYQGLVQGGLNTWETTQAVARHTASASYIASSLLAGTGGVLSLLPQIGSPFAMKYGGVELGGSTDLWAQVLRDTGRVAEVVAASAGLEAGFERRGDGWQHQVDLAKNEINQINKQLVGANIRVKIATRALDIHNKTIEQQQQVADFYNNRFSNLGLYTWLATTMQRLYRDAYNSAYAMARLAEQAYRFERNDDATTLLTGNYFNAQYAGLLAGESLQADLQDMERRFIETNYRTPEIDQAISLAQIAPAALVALRTNAACTFDIPEVFFDLFYPGQYLRKIKAVRLTIPCVTGPFTNVSATLTLTGSKLRLTPQLGAGNLTPVPLRRSVSIATSTAQSDSGVFEFSFRDERYMPFEGAGAVSSWSIALPSAFRQFDYQTITDVIVHIAYTAEEDGVFRQSVEQQNAALQGAILNVLSHQPLGRLFSLRQEFSTALSRLLHSAANTPVKITLAEKHLPIFVRGRKIQVTKAELLLNTPAGQTVAKLDVVIDGTSFASFAADATMGNLWSCDLSTVFAAGLLGDHTITISNAGDLAPTNLQPGDVSAVDETKLLDMMIYVEYKLA